MTSVKHCCEMMEVESKHPDNGICVDDNGSVWITVQMKNDGGDVVCIEYCPWCGKKIELE